MLFMAKIYRSSIMYEFDIFIMHFLLVSNGMMPIILENWHSAWDEHCGWFRWFTIFCCLLVVIYFCWTFVDWLMLLKLIYVAYVWQLDCWTVGLLLNVDIYGGVSYYLVVIFCVFFELWDMEYFMYNMIIEDKLNLLKWPTFLMYFCYINVEYFFGM